MRRLPDLLAVASLLAGVAVASLWLESETASDCWYRAWPRGQVMLAWGDGEVAVAVYRLDAPDGPPVPEVRFSHRAPAHPSFGWHVVQMAARPLRWWDRLGFHGLSGATGVAWAGRLSMVGVPFTALQGVTLVAPVARAVHLVRSRRRRRAGHCRRCGYDLRASPGRCPECGSAAGQ